MIEIREIKKFVLRLMNRAEGPMPDAAIDQAVKDGMAERPLQSDIDQAKNELEASGLMLGTDDDITGRAWGLTTKGTIKAKQLG